jgi:hypothetical protein
MLNSSSTAAHLLNDQHLGLLNSKVNDTSRCCAGILKQQLCSCSLAAAVRRLIGQLLGVELLSLLRKQRLDCEPIFSLHFGIAHRLPGIICSDPLSSPAIPLSARCLDCRQRCESLSLPLTRKATQW